MTPFGERLAEGGFFTLWDCQPLFVPASSTSSRMEAML